MTFQQDHSVDNPPTGSHKTGEPAFLVVGKLRRPHGVSGELLMEPYTDFPERLQAGVSVYVGETHQPLTIHSCRASGSMLLIRFSEYQTPEETGFLRHALVYVRTDDRPPLPEGEYYHHQILGLRVMSEDGRFLGVVSEILSNPANDVYIVKAETGRDILLPAINSVIRVVDLSRSEMLVHLLPGLLPEEN